MRVSVMIAGVVTAVVTAVVAYGDDPKERDRGQAVKPAWEWSLEERIASRIDPALMRQRAEAHAADLNRDRTPAGAQAHAAGARPIEFTVDGRRNPELLMPFELFGSVLRGVSPQFSDHVRKQYREAVTSFGWKEETFWHVLESAASDFFRAQTESLSLQARLSTLSPPDHRELETKIEELAYKQCRLRAEALRQVRLQLGRETFDRFLYSAVAPQVSIGSRIPVGDEAGRLRFIEGGCR
jgi:hypothetical protein